MLPDCTIAKPFGEDPVMLDLCFEGGPVHTPNEELARIRLILTRKVRAVKVAGNTIYVGDARNGAIPVVILDVHALIALSDQPLTLVIRIGHRHTVPASTATKRNPRPPRLSGTPRGCPTG